MSDNEKKPKRRYRVLRGLSFLGQRAEPGEVRDDIPEQSVAWLLRAKAIAPAKEPRAKKGAES